MPITKDEAQNAIDLYDFAMTGDIDSIIKMLDLFTLACCGDYNAEGLAWAIVTEVDRRNAEAKKNNKSETPSPNSE